MMFDDIRPRWIQALLKFNQLSKELKPDEGRVSFPLEPEQFAAAKECASRMSSDAIALTIMQQEILCGLLDHVSSRQEPDKNRLLSLLDLTADLAGAIDDLIEATEQANYYVTEHLQSELQRTVAQPLDLVGGR